jgi:hypothetical protein
MILQSLLPAIASQLARPPIRIHVRAINRAVRGDNRAVSCGSGPEKYTGALPGNHEMSRSPRARPRARLATPELLRHVAGQGMPLSHRCRH